MTLIVYKQVEISVLLVFVYRTETCSCTKLQMLQWCLMQQTTPRNRGSLRRGRGWRGTESQDRQTIENVNRTSQKGPGRQGSSPAAAVPWLTERSFVCLCRPIICLASSDNTWRKHVAQWWISPTEYAELGKNGNHYVIWLEWRYEKWPRKFSSWTVLWKGQI